MSKVICIKPSSSSNTSHGDFADSVQVTQVATPEAAIRLMTEGGYDGIYFCWQKSKPDDTVDRCRQTQALVQGGLIFGQIPDGVALLDEQNQIIHANSRLTSWFEKENLVGLSFYSAVGHPNILGAEPTPLSSALHQQKRCEAILQVDDRYFSIVVAPFNVEGQPRRLILTMRDTTEKTLARQKLQALRAAGIALADLRPEEIFEMDVESRIELLKQNILHYTKDLLDFDVVEIRLLDQATGQLQPLLSVGIDSKESKQPLFAKSTDNGVTGFVVATGHSYMCEDTANDPLYLDGLIGARSCLTVPLIYQEEVIGSFNVESPEVGAFTEADLEFVEAFARDIAVSLNTLELLVAQQTNAAQESVEAIHSAVALPIDAILNDTVRAIESYIGHDPEVTKRLRAILKNARDIKDVIQKVGEKMAPAEAVPAGVQVEIRPALKNCRVLVIDVDEQVRISSHNLLERYGCVVETAGNGEEALMMLRNCGPEHAYSAIIADIRLPDISGYDLLIRLKEIVDDPPLILMTGFGYDPGHSIVKARKAGLKPNSVLYKPFRLDQLLATVESIVAGEADAENQGAVSGPVDGLSKPSNP